MITAVSMNPCIDLTLVIDKFTKGASHRTKKTQSDLSGKAVNTVRALTNLNEPCRLLGFNFSKNGSLLTDSLDGIEYDFIEVPGSIRTNVKIFEEHEKRMTEINQEGDNVPQEYTAALVRKILSVKTNVLILSGSLPTGVSKSIYADIIRKTDATVILDAYGEAFSEAVSAGPFIIKPNICELEQAYNVSLPDTASRIAFCADLIKKNKSLKAVCLSLGGDGSYMIGENEAYFSAALDIPVKGVQGAGDSMVAGIAAELNKSADTPLDVLLKTAAAAAAASVILDGTQMCNRQGFDEMMKRVKVEKIRI